MGEMPAQPTASKMLPPLTIQNGVTGYLFGDRFIPRMAGAEDDPKTGDDPKPADPKKDDGEEWDKERGMATIRTLRQQVKDGKATAKQLEEAQTKLREFEDKDKSELEKATTKATAVEQQLTAAQTKVRDLAIRVAVAETASAAGIAPENVRAAIRLLDASAVELDDDGEPKNVEAALKQLVKDFPILAAQTDGDKKTGTATRSVPTTPKPAGAPGQAEKQKAEVESMRATGRYSI